MAKTCTLTLRLRSAVSTKTSCTRIWWKIWLVHSLTLPYCTASSYIFRHFNDKIVIIHCSRNLCTTPSVELPVRARRERSLCCCSAAMRCSSGLCPRCSCACHSTKGCSCSRSSSRSLHSKSTAKWSFFAKRNVGYTFYFVLLCL